MAAKINWDRMERAFRARLAAAEEERIASEGLHAACIARRDMAQEQLDEFLRVRPRDKQDASEAPTEGEAMPRLRRSYSRRTS